MVTRRPGEKGCGEATLHRVPWGASQSRWDLSKAPEEADTEHAGLCRERREHVQRSWGGRLTEAFETSVEKGRGFGGEYVWRQDGSHGRSQAGG